MRLCTQLHEIQAQLESEQSARYEAEMALLEQHQALVEMERKTTLRVTKATEQLRQNLENRHKCEIKAQMELIGMFVCLDYRHIYVLLTHRTRAWDKLIMIPLRPAIVDALTRITRVYTRCLQIVHAMIARQIPLRTAQVLRSK